MELPERHAALDRAHHHARAWLASLSDRAAPAQADVATVMEALGTSLPDGPTDPEDVVDLLAAAVEPGLSATPSGRYFGFVVGGTHPAALAADWLVSAWDQNVGLRALSAGGAALEEVAGTWLVDLLGLPAGSAVGFTTGATMANFSGLAAARDALLRRAGHDPAHGLAGTPPIRVLAGAEVHGSMELALRYLGLGTPELLDVDAQGTVLPRSLSTALATGDGRPTLLALQAGNIHSGASDPFEDLVPLAHRHGAWVHVDGAFGLWAAASPTYRPLVAAVAEADSWATDAHKTLNVPYDSGLVIVRDPADLRIAMTVHGAYLVHDAAGDPHEKVPEMSRRMRGAPVWAVLRSLGRSGVADLVDGLCLRASQFADGAATIPGATVVNDVVFTQVCVSFGDDARTDSVVAGMLADGTAWMTGSRWHDEAVLRISVSNWSTTSDDVRRSLDALRRVTADVVSPG
jgi:glutamate/tyrosine decarboxylase-like PLP-dependent enzyme